MVGKCARGLEMRTGPRGAPGGRVTRCKKLTPISCETSAWGVPDSCETNIRALVWGGYSEQREVHFLDSMSGLYLKLRTELAGLDSTGMNSHMIDFRGSKMVLGGKRFPSKVKMLGISAPGENMHVRDTGLGGN